MALSIKNDEADRLARELTDVTGESLTDAIVIALRERVERVRRAGGPSMGHRLERLQREIAELQVLDPRDADDIIGYDEHGLPA